jgi:hypothetical protein
MLVDRLGEWLTLIREVRGSANGRAAMGVLLRYILATNSDTPSDFVQRLVAATGEEAMEEIWSTADQLEEGGRVKGYRTSLLKLLRSRFGDLPEAAVAKVNSGDAAHVEAWFDLALTATGLDQVFGPT